MNELVVTGATGYIGRVLVAAAVARGWRVVAASRHPAAVGVPWIRYALSDELRAEDFPRGATIVHLAAITSAAGPDTDDLEVRAARRLVEVARERATRVIFVSSQTARSNAPTAYGRLKWRIEQEILGAGGSVVRPGLVYGGAPGGVFGRLLALAVRVPILPQLVPAPRVQPIHVADLAAGILGIAERSDLPAQAFNLAAEEPVSFTLFMHTMAANRLRRRRLWLPVPAALVDALAGVLPDPERIRSLLALPRVDTAEHLRLLDLRLRPLAAGMNRSGDDRRRRLLAEGAALLAYVLRERAPRGPLVRYARAIETFRGGAPVGLPRWTRRWPAAIALFDRMIEAHELEWRLDAAVVLAEASVAGARRLLALQRSAPVGAALRIATAVAGEGLWRALRVVLRPLARRALARAARE